MKVENDRCLEIDNREAKDSDELDTKFGDNLKERIA